MTPQVNDVGSAMNRSIQASGLSVRAKKCCQRLGVYSVDDLAQFTSEDILLTRNAGEITLMDIREWGSRFAVFLKDEAPLGHQSVNATDMPILLRDWLAGQAMPLIFELILPSLNSTIDDACRSDGLDPEECDQEARSQIAFDVLSSKCYEFAEAMIKVRKAKSEGAN